MYLFLLHNKMEDQCFDLWSKVKSRQTMMMIMILHKCKTAFWLWIQPRLGSVYPAVSFIYFARSVWVSLISDWSFGCNKSVRCHLTSLPLFFFFLASASATPLLISAAFPSQKASRQEQTDYCPSLGDWRHLTGGLH